MFSSLLNWNKQRFRSVDHRQLAKLDRLLTEVFLSCNHWWRFEWWWQQEDNITMANMIMMSKGHVSASVNRADWNRDDLHCAQWTHWRSSDHLPPDWSQILSNYSIYSHNRRQHPIWSKTQSSLRQVEAQVIIITIFVIIISITSIHHHHHHQTLYCSSDASQWVVSADPAQLARWRKAFF